MNDKTPLEYACNELIAAERAFSLGEADAAKRATRSLWWVTRLAGTAVRGGPDWSAFLATLPSGARTCDAVHSATQSIVGHVLLFPGGYLTTPDLVSTIIAAVLTLGMFGHTQLGLTALNACSPRERANIFSLICASTKDSCPVRSVVPSCHRQKKNVKLPSAPLASACRCSSTVLR